MRNNQFVFGIVGFGGMGHFHTEKVSHLDRAVVDGVYDIDPSLQGDAEKQGLKFYPTREALLANEDIDIILIATPNDSHKDIAIAAMRAGKHVISEKPVAMDSKEVEEMIAVSQECGKIFTVHQNRRWDSDYLTVKRIFDEDLLGGTFNIESRVHGARGIPGGWREEKEHGGGMILDWGVHILDQALMMIPEKLKTIYTKLQFITNEIVDDGFKAILTFESGKTFHLEVGTSNFINLPRWYVQGADGTAVINSFDPRDGYIISAKGESEKDIVPVVTAAGLTKTMAPRREDTIKRSELPAVDGNHFEFYENVFDAILGKEPLRVKPHEFLRSMRAMEAMFESGETGKVVEFE